LPFVFQQIAPEVLKKAKGGNRRQHIAGGCKLIETPQTLQAVFVEDVVDVSAQVGVDGGAGQGNVHGPLAGQIVDMGKPGIARAN